MTPEELQDLVGIAAMRKQHAEAELARISRREAQLRALLDEIAEQFQRGLSHADASSPSMRSLGAHQAWVDFARRRRADINRDLALVMAAKLDAADRLRRKVGQHMALSDLQAAAVQARARDREERAQEDVLARFLHNRSNP